MRLLNYLLLLILCVFPFGELLRFSLGNDVYVRLLDGVIFIASLVFFAVFLLHRSKKTFHFPSYLFFFPIMGIISLLIHAPMFTSNEIIIALFYAARWIVYVFIYLIVANATKSAKEKVVTMMLISGGLFVFVGYLQYFFFNDIRYFIYLGWDDHIYRMFSTFIDPNYAATFFVLFFMFVLGFYFDTKKRGLKKYLLLLLSILTFIAIFLTYSRSGLLMLLVSGVSLLILLGRKKLIMWLLGALISFVIIISPFSGTESLNLFRTASTNARILSIENAVTIFADHPLLGVGFNSFRYVQYQYGFKSDNPKYPSNAAAGTDNSWLFVLSTTGILGFMAYTYMWFRLVQGTWILSQKRTILAKVALASLIGLFINAFFNNSLFFAPIMIWMWFLMGLLVQHRSD